MIVLLEHFTIPGLIFLREIEWSTNSSSHVKLVYSSTIGSYSTVAATVEEVETNRMMGEYEFSFHNQKSFERRDKATRNVDGCG